MSLKHNPFTQQKAEPIIKKKKIRIFDSPNIVEERFKEDKIALTIDHKIVKDKINNLNIESIENKYLNSDSEELNYRINIESIENKLVNKDRITIDESIVKPFNFDQIVGLQRATLLLLFEHCRKNGSKETRPLGIQFFTEKLNISQLNAHNVLNVLIKKKIIEKADFKRGRGGWSKLRFNEAIWNKLCLSIENLYENYRNLNIEQTIDESPSKKERDLNNLKFFLSQFPELEKVGLRIEHLEKSVRNETDIEQILTHFNHSLLNNEVRLKYKLPVLLSILNDSKKTWVSESYLSEINEELHRNDLRMSQYEELKKKQKEQELLEKFNEFKMNNLNFVEEIKVKNKNFTTDSSIIENLAFAEWKCQNDF